MSESPIVRKDLDPDSKPLQQQSPLQPHVAASTSAPAPASPRAGSVSPAIARSSSSSSVSPTLASPVAPRSTDIPREQQQEQDLLTSAGETSNSTLPPPSSTVTGFTAAAMASPSTTATTGGLAAAASTSANGVISRRAKACEYCRSLKVRCTPVDPEHPTDPCLRCTKASRDCVFHLGPRRRARKSDK